MTYMFTYLLDSRIADQNIETLNLTQLNTAWYPDLAIIQTEVKHYERSTEWMQLLKLNVYK